MKLDFRNEKEVKMDTRLAIIMKDAAITAGSKSKVFDWDKAAQLIKETQPAVAGAGLQNDWEWTGGEIYRDGEIVTDEYTYLFSRWATPEIEMDGELIECWRYAEGQEWDEDTKWPQSAIDILRS